MFTRADMLELYEDIIKQYDKEIKIALSMCVILLHIDQDIYPVVTRLTQKDEEIKLEIYMAKLISEEDSKYTYINKTKMINELHELGITIDEIETNNEPKCKITLNTKTIKEHKEELEDIVTCLKLYGIYINAHLDYYLYHPLT